ncbi:MAG TPA: HD domain-containing protein [Burkholderiaceae bacterium]|nr:HD domain-containing protein [Burkholderiaceae bacterium]
MNDLALPLDVPIRLERLRAEFKAERATGPLSAASLRGFARQLRAIPQQPNADGHVQLMFDILLGSGHVPLGLGRDYDVRGLYSAAWDSRAENLSPSLARRWYSSLAPFEAKAGRGAEAARCLAVAFRIADELGDTLGKTGVLGNLALLANGCGQYEDAIRFASIVLSWYQADGSRGAPVLEQAFVSALMNRGNAFFRLGRLAEARGDFERAALACLLGAGSRDGSLDQAREVVAVTAEVHVALGEMFEAGVLLDRIDERLPPGPSSSAVYELAVRRARALLRVARGDRAQGLAELHSVLADAEVELPEGATDDAVVDALFSLELAYRLSGDSQAAGEMLRRLGRRLRAAAETTLEVLATEPSFAPPQGVGSALAALDAYIERRAGQAESSAAVSVASLQQLVALASQASSLEEPTGEHGVRVSALAQAVGAALGLAEGRCRVLAVAALVHDAGKIGVPRPLLTQALPLSEVEQAEYDAHAAYSAELIERAAIPERQSIAEIVRLHHQPFDGVRAARPQNREAIPLEARILAACDRFDALVMGRPRRPAVPIDDALRDLLLASDREFDPAVVAAVIDTVRQLARQHADLLAFLAEDAEKFDYTASRRFLRKAAEPPVNLR